MNPVGDRSEAIDVLRGLTVALMIVVNMSVSRTQSYGPLLHAAWDGLTLTDLVFPTFMFVVGAALSFTLEKYQRLGDTAVLRKIVMRTVLLFLCGYLLSWFPFFTGWSTGHLTIRPLEHTRIMGVLQRIALGYGIAALIVHLGRRTGAVAYSAAALLGYWWLLSTFGDHTMAGNAATRFDKLVLGDAHLWHGEGVAFDPEGLLSTLPAVVNVLAGYVTGRFVRDRGANYRTIATLLLSGCVCVAVAVSWDPVLPINKKLWTSSYVLCTVGIDLAVLSVLLFAIDLRPGHRWPYFFEVFGRNTLFIFLLSELVEVVLYRTSVGPVTLFAWLYQNGFASWAGDKPGSLCYAVTYMLACWGIAYAMDRRRLYIRL